MEIKLLFVTLLLLDASQRHSQPLRPKSSQKIMSKHVLLALSLLVLIECHTLGRLAMRPVKGLGFQLAVRESEFENGSTDIYKILSLVDGALRLSICRQPRPKPKAASIQDDMRRYTLCDLVPSLWSPGYISV